MKPPRTLARKKYPKGQTKMTEVNSRPKIAQSIDSEQARRKRVQNRISQQCLREKQAAQSQQWTLFQDLLNESHGKGNIDSRLIDEGLRLMHENRRMRDTLLRMRKKMLSLSNSAAAVADDQIFDTILNSDRSVQAQNETVSTPHNEEGRENDPEMPTSEVPQLPSSDPHSIDEKSGEDTGLDDGAARTSMRSYMASNSSFQGSHILDAYSPTWLAPLISPPADQARTQIVPLNEEPHTLPPRIFGPCVEKTCVLYICRLLDMDVEKHQLDVNSAMAAIKQSYADRVADEVVADLAEIAVSLMAAFSGMTEYVYAVGASEVMEYILRWRISPTVANRLSIPEPFRPTPLQYSRTGYSISIDMINWPILRDQLILYTNDSNIDEIVYDVVLNTVIEIPQMQISLNVLDLFLNRVSKDPDAGHTATSNPHSWPPDIRYLSPQGLGDQTWRMINSRMGEVARLPDQDRSIFTRSRGSKEPKIHKSVLSSHYGLDRLPEWKLSMEFCQKYPFLDCSLFAASLPMVASESLLG